MGTIEQPRETPSFTVDSIEDISSLQKKSITTMHIQLAQGFNSIKEIAPLRDFLFGENGNCHVFFHLDIAGKTYIVKANAQLTVPNSNELAEQLKEYPKVKDVWFE